MYSLLQIILSMNSLNVPTVNVITHYNALEICENKLDETLKRNIQGGNDAKIVVDSESNKLLKIKFKNEDSISYWFCKETIFYK